MISSKKYLSPDDSQRELLTRLDPVTRAEFETGYGHNRIEPAFQDRVFFVYQAQGRNNRGVQLPPKILARIRVLSFIARDETGCTIRLLNEETNTVEEIDHVPRKVFGYPIFMSIPARLELKWDAHRHGAEIQRSLSYIVFIKARNKASFFSKNNIYMETANSLRELYPHVELDLAI